MKQNEIHKKIREEVEKAIGIFNNELFSILNLPIFF